MRHHLLFRQYAWLLDTIQRAGKISLEDLNNRWRATEMSGGQDLARATFNRHRNNIEEMFGIYIECDRKAGYTYYISNPEDLAQPTIQQWMVNSLSTTSLLIGCQDLYRRIILEDIPSSYHLDTVISAIQQNCCLQFEYQKFLESEVRNNICEPICLKLYRRRWYLLARNTSYQPVSMHIFALDRIKSCNLLTEMKYQPDVDFDANEYFRDYFGVLADKSMKAETIVIRAYGKQADYFRTLPLHHSQRELPAVTPEYTDFEFHIAPTNDFIAELISKNAWVEVISPLTFRQKIIDEIGFLQKRYGMK